jgi:hypothetical protein
MQTDTAPTENAKVDLQCYLTKCSVKSILLDQPPQLKVNKNRVKDSTKNNLHLHAIFSNPQVVIDPWNMKFKFL